MSFREKIAWITIVAHGVVFGGYFWALWQSWGDSYAGGLSLGLMIGAVVTLIILTVALTIAVSILSPKAAQAPADERERIIALKSERIGSFVLSVGVVSLIGALLAGWNAILVANLLLACMVIAEMLKAGVQILYFRTSV